MGAPFRLELGRNRDWMNSRRPARAIALAVMMVLGGWLLLPAPPASAEAFAAPNARVDDSLLDGVDEANPAIATWLPSTVYMAYERPLSIWFARSDDGGQSFGGWTVLSDVPASPFGQPLRNPDIAVFSNGTIYVVYDDEVVPGSFVVRVTWSVDGGVTWGNGIPDGSDPQVDDSPGNADFPTLAITRTGTIVVAWRDDRAGDFDVRASTSADGGLTWAPSARVNDDATAMDQGEAYAVASGDATRLVNLVWWDDRSGDGGDIMHAWFSGAGWSPNVRVDDDTTGARAREPAIVAGLGGSSLGLGVVYSDDRALNGDDEIRFTFSLDGGDTWGDGVADTDVAVSDTAVAGNAARFPDLARTQATDLLVAAWRDDAALLGDDDILSSVSLNDGGTWAGAEYRVNDDEVGNFFGFVQEEVALAAFGATAVAAWTDDRERNLDVFVSSTANGWSWGDGFTNDNDVVAAGWGTLSGGSQTEPQLVDYGTALYSLWTDTRDEFPGFPTHNLYFSNSSNGGNSWGDGILNNNDVRVDDGTNNSDAVSPDLAVDPWGRLYAIYSDNRGGTFDIYVTWSDNGGTVWGDGHINGNDVRVNDVPGGGQFEPAIAVDTAGIVYAVWEDARLGGDIDLYASRSLDRGLTWTPSVRVNDDGAGNTQLNPAIAANETSVNVIWEDDRAGNPDSLFSASFDRGATWSTNALVNDEGVPGPAQSRPALAIASGPLVAVWVDGRGASAPDIRSSFSADGGVTWGDGVLNDNDPIVNELIPAGAQAAPSIAADIMAYAVWQDDRGAVNDNIWFSKAGPLGWSANFLVNEPASAPAAQGTPEVAIDGTGVAVVWQDDRLGIANVWFSRAPRIEPSNAALDRILLTPWPGPTILAPSGVQGYRAVGIDTDGNVNATWTPVWGMTDGLGTVGNYGGSALGGHTADYTAGPIVGTDNITVAALGALTVANQSLIQITGPPVPSLGRIEISPWPGPVSVLVNGVLTFTALGYDTDSSLNTTWTPGWFSMGGLGTMGNFAGSAGTGWTADYTAGTIAGLDSVRVQDSVFPSIANATGVQVEPGPLAYLTLTPWPGPTVIQVTQTAPGYLAFGFDQYGNQNMTWAAVWGTTDALGTANPTGGSALLGYAADYAAGTVTGTDNITVAAVGLPGIANQSLIRIDGGPVVSLEILPWPGPTMVVTTGILFYSAWARDAFGNPNTTWTPIWGTTNVLGTATGTGGDPINGFTAQYLAGAAPGFDNITVAATGVIGIGNQSMIEIVTALANDPLVRIELTPWPGPVSVLPTAATGFIALGYSQSTLQNTTWTPTWTAGALGSITATGGNANTGFTATYTALTLAGADSITVTNTTTAVSNSTAISIEVGPLVRIELTPWPTVTLQLTGAQTFTALAFDAWDNRNVTWTAVWAPVAIGTLGGQTEPTPGEFQATFTAGTVAGATSVVVTGGGAVNETAITIEPGPLHHIDVTPAGPLTLNVATAQGFIALGYDLWNNPNTTWTATWSSVNALGTAGNFGGSAATGWTADYTATVVGADLLRVANGTVTTDVAITNTAPPGPLDRLTIDPWPGPTFLNPASSATFTALGYDAAGNLNTSWTAVWGTTNSLGTATPTGGSAAIGWTADFTATTPGVDNITVEATGLPAVTNQSLIQIAVSGVLARIELTPWPSVTVEVSASQGFTARAFDAAGNLNTSWTSTWGTTGGVGVLGSPAQPTPGVHTATFTGASLGSGTVNVTDAATGVRNETAVTVVDTGDPISEILDLPAVSRTLTLSLEYTASDLGGSGISHVEIWYQRDGGNWVWSHNATASPTPFTAPGDGLYTFYSIAADNALPIPNLEAPPLTPDATTRIDATPPTVTGTNPSNGATNVLATTTIQITFSEAMNQTNVATSLTVTAGGQTLTGTWSWNAAGTVASFTPSQALAAGTAVTMTITGANATDLAGNPMAADFTLAFTTASAGGVDLWVWLLLLLLVLLILFILFLLWRRRKKKEEPPRETAPSAKAEEAPATVEEEIPPPGDVESGTEETSQEGTET